MAVKEYQPLVNHCCTFCCKAIDFGTHDYCAHTKTAVDRWPSPRGKAAVQTLKVPSACLLHGLANDHDDEDN
ncbi:hypothetical protein E8E14_011925 [Neopestalotiopsis sp. 37M]|nr:hypothetical protein E8E14_011925 [Neopestalotiopsis sp. 37M]